MDSCQLAVQIAEELELLPQCEQVSRGHELMQLLAPAPTKVGSEKKIVCSKVGEVGWNVVVKKGFIDVVCPRSSPLLQARRRAMSDSALPCFEKLEEQWECIVRDSKVQDMADASTDGSVTAEESDAVGWSSESEAEAEVFAQQVAPYQYVESWWMPMLPYQAPESFAQGPMCYQPRMQWADHTVDNMECCGLETDAEPAEWRSTVMIRNMPNNYTREMLLEMVDSMGFAGAYDFAYLPVDFQNQAGLGYAFINFVSVEHAQLCFERFEGFSNWKVPSEKVCTVTWSSPTQGLEEHLERYRNSPVMHHSLPDEWRPVLLQQGVRIAFPLPTKPIKTPKVRQHPSAKCA